VLVFQVLDRDELDFPFGEAKIFEDLETGMRRQVSPAQIRKLYLDRLNAFMTGWKELFQALEMPYCVVRTDENLWNALALFLSERRKLK
jgi:hypothetical protein